jgi:MSHA pilin protein MshD
MKYSNAPITWHLQTGITLIELIISILIITIALTGIFSTIKLTVSNSADPLAEYQAITIAESYLEEILLHDYADPHDTVADEWHTNQARSTFDDVDDYNGMNETGVRDQRGNPIMTLTPYHVSVSVVPADVSNVMAKVITVTVTGYNLSPTKLIGYKFYY